MTTVTSTGSTAAAATTSTATTTKAKSGFGAMGTADFIKLMTTQMRQQDPFNPMDNKDMLAQMAQFSSLSATTDMSTTLKEIATKLDAVLTAQQAAQATAATTADTTAKTA
ncbi:flagellar hook assembly protein FlgD [Novosphingobium piscinae]|uniref:Basal-body rod modification protein FlgD n=1 Tax=Novosphingobium piscinae TaxID=1507448 RepID=A0A7X1G1V1_9SPHN|nr:flagellar hook capping FlgD N-terminal domain-containing protein [Novosphingobium piscinae]MBC2670457.1 flagellar biosynthesis protein FlgD [Novosphingobium piscinae]